MSAKLPGSDANASGFPSAGLPHRNAADGRPLNAMTVDVEDYFHVQAFADVIDRKDWDALPTRVESNTSRMLDLFASKRATATFFVLGWVAERFPTLVRRIADAGHEIGSHSYAHQRIFTQTPEEFRADVRRAKCVIEDAAAKPVIGYRAPTFSLNSETWWAYDVLAEEGYSYSSSIYPVARDNYGMPDAPRTPFMPTGSGAIVEIPMSTVRYGQRNFPSY
jgi:polysaccharide deacetylase family protein (PEP-CTERM system associated)